MAKEIILPALGETMDEGTIARWLVDSGASVSKGQVIAEIESNKAVFELESPATGVLEIALQAGATVPILSVIGTVRGPGETAETPAAPSGAAPRQAPQTATTPATAPPPQQAEASYERRFVSPRARRLAREKDVDVAAVSGSGPKGRVEERDVRAYLETRPRLSPLARKMAAEAGVALPPQAAAPRERIMRAAIEQRLAQPAEPPAAAPASDETVTPLSTVRRVIAQRMSQSAQTAAAVTLTSEVDATELVHLREQIKSHIEQQTGAPLSYNVLLARLAAVALRELPYMTARLVGAELRTPGAVNIGVAVDSERGLLVPVLRDVDHKSLAALNQEAAGLASKARSGAISADEMAGGVFTITNLGMYGIDAFTPIINLPECAILGVGRIAPRPVVSQGQIAVRQMTVLSLTFDHRIVDGAPAARFLQRLAELIQNPYVVLL